MSQWRPERLNIEKVSVLLKLTYRVLLLSQITPNIFLCMCAIWYADSKMYIDVQKTKNSENNLEEQYQNWRTYIKIYKKLLQNYNN